MISSEVQRTLVKSPPELWAEISDPTALARHLGEFGEIRITRVEPEQRIEWEAGDTSGSVVIKPSGWGTKVKLTVNRERAQLDETADDEPPAEAAADSELQQPAVVQPTETAQPPITTVEDAKPDLAAEPQPQEQARPEPQRQAEPEPQEEAERGRRAGRARAREEPQEQAEPAAGRFPSRAARAGAAPGVVCSSVRTPSGSDGDRTCAGGRQRRRD